LFLGTLKNAVYRQCTALHALQATDAAMFARASFGYPPARAPAAAQVAIGAEFRVELHKEDRNAIQ